MINLQNLAEERLMNLPDAATYIGKLTGQKPHLSTLWRWCLKGCKGVMLDSICIGSKRFVTVSAIERFIEARSRSESPTVATVAAVPPSAEPRVTRHLARRREEIEAARRRLDELTGRGKSVPRAGAPSTPNQSA